jgi:hypothetical protein
LRSTPRRNLVRIGCDMAIALTCSFPLCLIVLWTGPFDLAFAGVPILLTVWMCVFDHIGDGYSLGERPPMAARTLFGSSPHRDTHRNC